MWLGSDASRLFTAVGTSAIPVVWRSRETRFLIRGICTGRDASHFLQWLQFLRQTRGVLDFDSRLYALGTIRDVEARQRLLNFCHLPFFSLTCDRVELRGPAVALDQSAARWQVAQALPSCVRHHPAAPPPSLSIASTEDATRDHTYTRAADRRVHRRRRRPRYTAGKEFVRTRDVSNGQIALDHGR
jgi:hypothetical protein